MVNAEFVTVEVVFALPDNQVLRTVEMPAGSTVNEAVDASGIEKAFKDIDLGQFRVAVWGELVDRDRPVVDGDRVEILRPLDIDPRDARRLLASEGRTMSGDS